MYIELRCGRSDADASTRSQPTEHSLGCGVCDHLIRHPAMGLATPKDESHCHTCHASWKGVREVHCKLCHRTFGSVAISDDAGCPDCPNDEDLVRMFFAPDLAGVWRRRPPGWYTGAASVSMRQRRAPTYCTSETGDEGFRVSSDVSDGVNDG